jgi:hypothetical protein
VVNSRRALPVASAVVAGLAVACAVGCSLVLGIQDRSRDPLEDAGADAASVPVESGTASDATTGDSTIGPDAAEADQATGDDGPAADASRTNDAPTSPDALADAPTADGGDGGSPVEGGGCGDPTSDPHNCGRCGHDCLGGMCAVGACQAVALVAADSGVSPFRLAQDDQSLFWTDRLNGAINRTPKSGGTTTTMWRTLNSPSPVAVDDAGVYWADYTGVWRCPKGGCPISPTFVSATQKNVHGLAVDDNNVYWSDDSAQLLLSAPKDGIDAGARTLWSSDAAVPYEVRTDGQNVYFGGSDSLLHVVTVDGGGAADGAPIAIGVPGTESSLGVALQGGYVYWTVTNFTSAGQGPIWSASTSALSPVQIVLNQFLPGALASDGTRVFWLDFTLTNNGDLRTCTIVGCSNPTVLATGILSPWSVVVDDVAVYWTDEGNGTGVRGSLWKLAK